MASQTTYTCDRCGAEGTQMQYHEKEGYIQLWTVGFSLNVVNGTINRFSPLAKSAEWCRKCCSEFDFLVDRQKEYEKAQKEKDEAKPFVPVTLEDTLREFIIEEIGNSQQN